MAMDRRTFFKYLGLGATVATAPTVKSAVELPTIQADQFVGGALKVPVGLPDIRKMLWDVQDGILYDRIRFEPGQVIPARVRFFSVPIGQVCPYSNQLKSYRHTNMFSVGQLNPPCQFLAQRILFAVHPSANEADLEAISAAAYWEFSLMYKIMARGPMLLNGPARAGLRDIVKPDGKPVDPMPDEVVATARHQSSLGGMLIPGLVHFAVEVSHVELSPLTLLPGSQGGRGLDFLIAFQGLEARSVR